MRNRNTQGAALGMMYFWEDIEEFIYHHFMLSVINYGCLLGGFPSNQSFAGPGPAFSGPFNSVGRTDGFDALVVLDGPLGDDVVRTPVFFFFHDPCREMRGRVRVFI